MSTAQQLAAILANRKQEDFASNPFILASQFMQPMPVRDNNTTSGIASGIQGLARGIMTAYGANQARGSYNDYVQGLNNYFKTGDLSTLSNDERYADVIPTLYQEKLDRDNSMQTKLLDIASDPQRAMALGRMGLNIDVDPERQRFSLVKGARALGGQHNAVTPIVDTQGGSAPVGSPVQSIQQRAEELMINMGLDPKDALDAAGKELDRANTQAKNQKDAAREQIKDLDEVRTKAKTLNEIADTVTAVAPAAGLTGSGPVMKVAQYGNKILGEMGIESQRQKLEASQLLDSQRAKAMALAKVPGAGSVSDYESQLFVSAGPGTHQLPETNAKLAQAFKARAAFDNSYADFISSMVNAGTSRGQADAAWQQIMGGFQLVTPGPDGLPVINQPPDWKSVVAGAMPQPMAKVRPAPGNVPGQVQAQQYDPSDEARIQARIRQLQATGR